MRKLAVLLVVAVAFSAAASAAPILCTDASLTSVQALINSNEGGGCYVQDKLFTNWSYNGNGGTSASNVIFNVATTIIPGVQDIHGFTFQPTDGTSNSVWTVGFSLGYTISVIQPSVQIIVGAYDQITLGSLPNPVTATSTKGNGVVFNLSQTSQNASSLFSGVTSLTSLTDVTIGSGGFVQNLSENYTQISTPEPMTFVLIGSGLIGLGLIRRKARKS